MGGSRAGRNGEDEFVMPFMRVRSSAERWRRMAKARKDLKMASWSSRLGSS